MPNILSSLFHGQQQKQTHEKMWKGVVGCNLRQKEKEKKKQE